MNPSNFQQIYSNFPSNHPPSHNSKSLLHDITIKDSSSLIDHDEFFNEVYSRGIFLIDVPANEIHTYTTGYILWQFRP